MDCNDKGMQLLDDFWQWRLSNSPEFATFSGIHEFDDKLESYTLDAILERKVVCRKYLNDCQQILNETNLKKEISENLDFLVSELKCFIRGADAKGYFFPLNYMEGPHLEFERLIASMNCETLKDFNKILSRYKELPVQISQMTEIMRDGIKQKMTFHKISVAAIPDQIDVLDQLDVLEKNPEECIFYKPFLSLPDTVTDEKKKALLLEAVDSISHNVIPAFKMLKEFLEKEYFKHCRPKIGIFTLPNGIEIYQMCLDFHLSYFLTPEEVHEIGKKEVERILKEMETVIESLELKMSVKEFAEKMREDDDFYFNDAEELIEAYKGLVFNKIQPLLGRVVNKIPDSKLEIRPSSASMSGGPAAYYLAGTFDGKRPGVFYVNAGDVKAVPKYDMVSLALHEALPGHHLQASYLMECKDLAEFRKYIEDRKYSESPSRFPLHTAYIEGWGLYSEYLGNELGLYDDPYIKFGYLSHEMLRALRLVADTGLHAFGWSIEKTVNYMLDHCAISRKHIENEVNRYITWPGQACAYKIGEIKIKSLRAMAERVLGPSFNIQEFHGVILQHCGPLDLLEKKVQEYIKLKA
ncbi:uncharacterized protein LOC129988158 [Argiope bruennichi]|uniref:DUF885 domain-containing protein n=1 Tax=Argiope bruennichi TaxID=94029 RepID=A0A8T0ECH9_ARGBR|nr:uncharacterized protein LOC129988158 [Argiope bruennichi]XP_055952286.1 uncharacterized protein LOC129988158 [Argiope bruennichi]KAF8770333.1 hypothetical protein HNY73_017878 [Argiope bruennichi]